MDFEFMFRAVSHVAYRMLRIISGRKRGAHIPLRDIIRIDGMMYIIL
jgi:hypothetical protein